jgi:hypothetical protein
VAIFTTIVGALCDLSAQLLGNVRHGIYLPNAARSLGRALRCFSR